MIGALSDFGYFFSMRSSLDSFSSTCSNNVGFWLVGKSGRTSKGCQEPNEVWNFLFCFDEGLFVLVNLIDLKVEVVTKIVVCLWREL